ncbi:transcriptional repressor NrdR [Candidatus Uhrbacteria bacterium]|jgi:transcriptional repressor NrdR|nr:transcriptional repressor NrdR [Candidatus Uhrbacteria bacterium]
MNCPICIRDTKVVDTRLSSDGLGIRRRRECIECEYRFSTVEEVELMDLTIVKREGKRETYSREKLLKGIVRSLEKRPYTEAGLKTLMHSIEQDIQRTKQQELSSAELGDVVMERLRTFDKVAYIRFASVYRQFEDVQTFQRELNELIRKRNKTI